MLGNKLKAWLVICIIHAIHDIIALCKQIQCKQIQNKLPSSDEGRDILPKIRELLFIILTLCTECFIRNYVSRVQNIHSQIQCSFHVCTCLKIILLAQEPQTKLEVNFVS